MVSKSETAKSTMPRLRRSPDGMSGARHRLPVCDKGRAFAYANRERSRCVRSGCMPRTAPAHGILRWLDSQH